MCVEPGALAWSNGGPEHLHILLFATRHARHDFPVHDLGLRRFLCGSGRDYQHRAESGAQIQTAATWHLTAPFLGVWQVNPAITISWKAGVFNRLMNSSRSDITCRLRAKCILEGVWLG
jgi:hypothetical protein